MKRTKIVWFDETESIMPELQEYEDDKCHEEHNGDEIIIACAFRKPKQNAKKIKITVETIK